MTPKTQLLSFLFCFLFLLPQTSFSQTRDMLLERLIRKSDIQTRECYNTVIVDGQLSPLSVLTSKMTFDSLGRPINYTTYEDSLMVSSFLVYFYDENNNLIKSEVREKNKTARQTVIHVYNKQGLKIKKSATLGEKITGEIDYFYQEGDLLERLEIGISKKTKPKPKPKPKRQSVSYTYDEKSRLKMTTFDTHFKGILESEYDSVGNVVREYFYSRKKSKNSLSSEITYDDQNQVILRKNYEYKNQQKFNGLFNVSTDVGDVVVIKTEYFTNGLVANETEFRNDVLITFREYEYLGKSSK